MTGAVTLALHRALALLLLLAIPALAYVAVVMPLSSYRGSLGEEIARLEDNLVRYRGFADERAGLEEALAAAEAAEPDAALYLEGASDALAAARLQDLLGAIVGRHGATLDSVRVMPASAEGDYRRVAVEVLLESRIEALREILYAIETGKPFLFVKVLDVAESRRFRPGPGAVDTADLDVLLEIYAYRREAAS